MTDDIRQEDGFGSENGGGEWFSGKDGFGLGGLRWFAFGCARPTGSSGRAQGDTLTVTMNGRNFAFRRPVVRPVSCRCHFLP